MSPDLTDPLSLGLLVVVGAIASGINSVAGGGSLISFPTLLFLGVPSLTANATNSVGLWPGSLSGAWGFRNVLPATKKHLLPLVGPTILGAGFGAWLVSVTDKKIFDIAVPILLFMATALLWFQPAIRRWSQQRGHALSLPGAMLLQTLVALYGGYFGAGMGIMMLAVFFLFMEANIHEINAVKTILGVFINLMASAVFVFNGMVLVAPALALVAGSLVGGYYAARWSQKMDPEKLRKIIAVYGLAMSTYFAYRIITGG
ncbi:MAG: sulfite exporter TauE/SafE family protein [Methanoregulaceae archaeon]|nr:sulfite exporter TauE/SafE family protein [Methanoregulaceae archaeon]